MNYLDKIRQFEEQPETSVPDTMIESAGNLSPVYWDSAGRILGPGKVSHVLKSGDRFFLCVEYAGSWRWIHESLLRSRAVYEAQWSGLKVPCEAQLSGRRT